MARSARRLDLTRWPGRSGRRQCALFFAIVGQWCKPGNGRCNYPCDLFANRRKEQCCERDKNLQQVTVSTNQYENSFHHVFSFLYPFHSSYHQACNSQLPSYNRVSCAQKMSFVNSQIKHQTDWAAVAKNPKLVRTRFPRWIYQHDPEAYAYEKYGLAFQNVSSRGNTEFKNENLPPDHEFKKWTIDEIKKEIRAGKSVEALLDGDWS